VDDDSVVLVHVRAARYSGIAREHVAAEVGRWCDRQPTELEIASVYGMDPARSRSGRRGRRGAA